MAHLTRALRHRNYRLFFAGQSLSLVGTWICIARGILPVPSVDSGTTTP